MKKKIISVLLAISLISHGLSGMVAQASEPVKETRDYKKSELESVLETQIIETDTLDEFIQAVLAQEKSGAESFSENRTLIISAEGSFDTFGASTVIKGNENAAVLIYENEANAREAYNKLKALEGKDIESVTGNAVIPIADAQPEDAVIPKADAQPEEVVEDKNSQTGDTGQIPQESSELKNYMEQNRTSSEVLVAIVDTGVNLEDEKIQNRIVDIGLNLSSDEDKTNIQDGNGHGTIMAGIIAENTMENVKLMPIKSANASGEAAVLSTYLAIRKAVEQNADIILVSVSVTAVNAPILKNAIQEASAQGILTIVPAGDGSIDTSGSSPADEEEALVISAAENGRPAAYSNYGETMDYCADGTYLETRSTCWAAARAAAMAAELSTFLDGRKEIENAFQIHAQVLDTKGGKYYGGGFLGEFQPAANNIEQGSADSEIKEQKIYNEEGLPHGSYWDTMGDRRQGGSHDSSMDFATASGGFTMVINGPLGRSILEIGIPLSDTRYDTSKPLNVTISGNNIYGVYQTVTTWTAEDIAGMGRYTVLPLMFGFGSKGIKNSGEIWPVDGTYGIPMGFYGVSTEKNKFEMHLSTNNTGFTDWAEPGTFRRQTVEMRLERSCYDIVYDGNGGSGSIPAQNVNYGDRFSLNAGQFNRTGYTFKGYAVVRSSDNNIYCGALGWQPAEKYGSSSGTWTLFKPGTESKIDEYWINSAKPHDNDRFLFKAQWEPNTYTIKYVGNGADLGNVAAQTVSYNTGFNIQGNGFSRSGYAFKGYAVVRSSDNMVYCGSLGWQPMSSYGSRPQLWTLYQPGSRNTMDRYWISANVNGPDTFTFYAQWERNSYTVTYSANGGKSVSKSSAEVFYGDSVDLGVTAVPKDSYYTFIGWAAAPNAKETLASQSMGAGNVTLYALYSIPVSDVKQLYLQAWDKKDVSKTKLYPMTRTKTSSRGYTYKLDKMNYAAGFSDAASVLCRILACDNANNWSVIKTYNEDTGTKPEVPVQYLQTVEHYRYDRAREAYVKFASVNAYKNKGETYAPQYITSPDGYQRKGIDAAYTVAGEKISKAYYDNISYKIYFNANGGSCSTASKTAYYGEPYGEMPRPSREGYIFQGWYTADKGGTRKAESDLYEIKGNSTVYAQWKIDSHMVYYDYFTNGGTGADKTSGLASYGSAVELRVNAAKAGWEFVGWNTDPNAKTALKSLTMGTKDVYLYAIYKKVLNADFVDQSDMGLQNRRISATIYNRETEGRIEIPKQNNWKGWDKSGWTLETDAAGMPDASEGAEYHIGRDQTFYGLYTQNITVTYDTNGPGTELPAQIGIRSHNAAGNYENPEFILAEEQILNEQSFVCWADVAGEEHPAGKNVVLEKNMLYTARWDRYPEIEAYDRYFTLSQAQNGSITSTELLRSVNAADREDGILEIGTAVWVKNFNQTEFKDFTEDGSLSVTYQAVDSFGNSTEKLVNIHLADTGAKESREQEYLRYINSAAYREGDEYVASGKGGLQDTSLWKSDEAYKAALDHAMDNQKEQTQNVKISFFGMEYELENPGSGNWEHVRETWDFTKEEREQMKEFVKENGFGKYGNKRNGILFYEKFDACRR